MISVLQTVSVFLKLICTSKEHNLEHIVINRKVNNVFTKKINFFHELEILHKINFQTNKRKSEKEVIYLTNGT